MNPEFIVMSPNYEILRYGHDKIKRQTEDAHVAGKLSKFIVSPVDLIDPDKPPTPDNLKFEARQIDDADVWVYVDRKPDGELPANKSENWGRKRKRVNKIDHQGEKE